MTNRCGSAARTRWFVDSPLEGDGFEPSVPRSPVSSVGAACRSCLRGSGSGSARFLLLGEILHRAGLPYGLGGLRFATLLGRFFFPAVQFVYIFALHRLDQQFAERPNQGINAVITRCNASSRIATAGSRALAAASRSQTSSPACAASPERRGATRKISTSVFRAPPDKVALTEYEAVGIDRAVLEIPDLSRDEILRALDGYGPLLT